MLKPKPLGLAAGVLWGGGCLFAGITSIFGWGDEFVKVMGDFYWGYSPGIVGAVIGGVWGFIDGFIGGFLLALLYNLFAGE